MKFSKQIFLQIVLFIVTSAIFVFLTREFPGGLRYIRLTQWFGFCAIACLYLYLFLDVFSLSLSKKLLLPLTLFTFAHSGIAFFGEIGGFSGLSFLPPAFSVGVYVGVLNITALIGLLLLNSLKKMSDHQKQVLRFMLHLIGLSVIFHVLILGTHYESYIGTVFRMSFVLVSVLLLAEVFARKLVIPTILLAICIGFVGGKIFSENPDSLLPILNMHGNEMQFAENMKMNSTESPFMARMNAMSTMRGDRTKRYTVSFDHPTQVNTNSSTLLSFTVYDAASGNQVRLFQLAYTKLIHMVVVDDELKFFNHIHPSQNGDKFVINTQFPHDGLYHIYLSFQPIGAIEQQFGLTLFVGPKTQELPTVDGEIDTNLTKTFDDITVQLTDPHLVASQMMKGEQTIRFLLTNSKTGEPITDLAPYLAAFGHLVMVNTKTHEYLHVHPTNLTAPLDSDRGGPTVDFVPISIFDPIHPGTYRLFAQFNPDNKLFTADFTVVVE